MNPTDPSSPSRPDIIARPDLALTDREKVCDELARQYAILEREKWQRMILTTFAYALCVIFAEPRVMVAFIVIDITAELLCLHFLRGLDPVATPGCYRASVLAVLMMEMAFASAAGLVWLEDDPYAKALRAGLAMTTLLQLSTVWSIHLPYGFARLLTVAVVITGFVLAHWIDQNNMIGLALTSAAAMGGVAYALTAMRSNHGLHRNSAGRAAAARASDAAKSLFLAQMSHELRSPLNAIIGLGEVEAVRAQGLSQDRLRALVTSARGLAVVLDDVLDLAAITDGRVAISPAPTDLRATLQAAMALLEPEAINSGTRFDLILPADLPSHVALDAQRLRQCLTNLVGNVIKHAAGSSVRITSEQRAGLLTSFVADAGPGVPTALAQTLFEPFHRGCANLPGLGLGLGINRSPARQMGRDLIHAPAARGAVFRLLVTAPKEPAPPPATELPVLGGRRILVVDDIATNRLVAASLLHALGPRWSRLMAGPRRYFWLRGRDRPCVSGHGDARDGRI